jgi:hypothetical protein
VTQLDVEWRKRLEFAALHYAEAKKAVIRASERDMQETMAAERAALREYTQILAIFTRLVLDGKQPTNDYEGEPPLTLSRSENR